MKIILDNIIFSLQKSGGISAYWFELLSRFINDNNFEIEFLEDKNYNIFRNRLPIEVKHLKFYKSNHLSRIFPVKINDTNKIFHSSYYRYTKNKNVKVITTVHDFIQEKINNSTLNLNSIMKRRAILNSDAIITISNNTKNDLMYYYPQIDPNKIHVIYNGVSDCYYPITNNNELLNNVLFVGSRVDYKKFDLAVDVISKFSNLNFTIVGNALSDYELKLLNNKLSSNRWNLVLNPTNTELNTLYNQSVLLLYPSSYEGFGIPIIEAMKAGCPVVALNGSSIPEVAGNAALLVDESTIDEYYWGIQEILKNRDYYVKLGFLNATRFSWDKTYLETIKLYKN